MNIKPYEEMPPVLAYLVVKEMLCKTLRCSMLHDATLRNISSGSWPHDQQFCAHMIGRLACRFGTFMSGSYDIDMTKRGDMLHGLAHPCTLLLTHLLGQAHSTDNLGAIKAIEFKHRLLKWFQNAYTPLPDGHPGCRGSCATNYGQHFRKLKKNSPLSRSCQHVKMNSAFEHETAFRNSSHRRHHSQHNLFNTQKPFGNQLKRAVRRLKTRLWKYSVTSNESLVIRHFFK